MMNIYKSTLSYSSSFCSQMFLGSSWDLCLCFQRAFLVLCLAAGASMGPRARVAVLEGGVLPL